MLTPSVVQNVKPKIKAYKLADERGMFLLVTPVGGKLWRLKYRRPVTKKENLLSLGQYPDVSLKLARERREEARRLLADGIDPGEHKKAVQAAGETAAANTFEAVAREWLARKAAHEWVATQTAKETRNFEKHVFHRIGRKPIADIDVNDLSPIILRLADGGHHELAHRLRANLSRVLVFAAATGRVAKGMNAAAPLKELMPPRRPSKRMPTITDPAKIADLLRAIDAHGGTFIVGCALKLSAMWACRPGEIRKSEWTNVNLEGEHPTLTIPPAFASCAACRKRTRPRHRISCRCLRRPSASCASCTH